MSKKKEEKNDVKSVSNTRAVSNLCVCASLSCALSLLLSPSLLVSIASFHLFAGSFFFDSKTVSLNFID